MAAYTPTFEDHRLLKFDNAGDDVGLPQRLQDALLPYFAMGFTPVFTSSQHKRKILQCGFHALCKSYNAAGSVLGLHEFRPTSVDELTTFFASKKYHEMLQLISFHNMVERPKLIESAQHPYDLSDVAIACLLRVLNENRGTHFELGIVRDGYRCGNQWDFSGAKYALDLHLVVATAPIIWVFHDNASVKAGKRGQTSKKSVHASTSAKADKGDEPENSKPEPVFNHWVYYVSHHGTVFVHADICIRKDLR